MSTIFSHIDNSAEVGKLKAIAEGLLLEISGKLVKDSKTLHKTVKGSLGGYYEIFDAVYGGEDIVLGLRKMIDDLKNYDEIDLELGFVPSKAFTQKLHSWVGKNINEKGVLNVKESKKGLLGVKVIHSGKLVDLSVNSKIDEFVRKSYK